ncbi:nitroreductase family protein [Thermostaphylospora chromogena]|uniref:Nitroreductase domain-containing protein n=1 Tax=Thermostaphylospora chromogena TaxID=35622 RepID=A0A1H1FU78_9ACTN|nr:nitroreductase family protein [Thermostaphylospora chromogena]SDR04494.1 hypothetical protein SAMN04489764_3187 [Thermostaphylospora chromogena]
MPLLPENAPVDAVKEVLGRGGGAVAPPSVTARAAPGTGLRTAPPEPAPARPGPRIPLSAVLAGRRSVRRFAAAAVPAETLGSVLDLAEAAQRRQWPRAAHDPLRPDVLVAAYRVEGVPPGLHRRAPDGRLTSLGTPSWMAELPGRYTDAPCLLLICGTLHRAGADGYGGLLVRVGALGHAIWLAARTHALEASVYAGSSVEVCRELRAVEPGSRHLFTVALGYAHPDGER